MEILQKYRFCTLRRKCVPVTQILCLTLFLCRYKATIIVIQFPQTQESGAHQKGWKAGIRRQIKRQDINNLKGATQHKTVLWDHQRDFQCKQGSTQVWEYTLAFQRTQPRPAGGNESTGTIMPKLQHSIKADAFPLEQKLCIIPSDRTSGIMDPQWVDLECDRLQEHSVFSRAKPA